MRIVSIPCRQDNYAYLVICEETKKAAVVDPSLAAPVLAAIEREGVELVAVWNTHHHYDHVEGNKEVAKRFSDVQVVGHASDRGRIPGQTRFVEDGDEVAVGTTLRAQVLFNPGHTSGAISFFLREQGVVFTGDTLFAAGCGRLFEGKPEEMYGSLMKLCALPAETKVYCGHEYTLSNLQFAQVVEPGNQAISARLKTAEAAREAGESTMGGTVAEELATNVFVRCSSPEVVAAATAHEEKAQPTPAEVFAVLRRWKDQF